MREVHVKPSRHRCRDCQAEFSRSTDLDRHLRACKVRRRRKEAEKATSPAPARVRRVQEEQPQEEPVPVPPLSVPEDLFLDCPEWGELDILEADTPWTAAEVPPSVAQLPTESGASSHASEEEPPREEGSEETATPPAEVVAVIPPWDPSHPDHTVFLSQVEATGWVIMPREEYAANLQRAAEAGEELRERLTRLATPASVPSLRPCQDASSQTDRVEEPRVYSQRVEGRTRLHVHLGAEVLLMDMTALDQGTR